MTRRGLSLSAILLCSVALSGCVTAGTHATSTEATVTDGASPSSTSSSPVRIGHDASGVVVTGSAGTKPTVVVPSSAQSVDGMQVVDLVEGSGDPVAAKAAVRAHYVGYGAMTGKQFDSSYDRGQPYDFLLSGVIRGWQLGIPGMKDGGRRLLIVPADLAYGETPPAGSGIESGETLVFVVDLVKHKNIPGQ